MRAVKRTQKRQRENKAHAKHVSKKIKIVQRIIKKKKKCGKVAINKRNGKPNYTDEFTDDEIFCFVAIEPYFNSRPVENGIKCTHFVKCPHLLSAFQ